MNRAKYTQRAENSIERAQEQSPEYAACSLAEAQAWATLALVEAVDDLRGDLRGTL